MIFIVTFAIGFVGTSPSPKNVLHQIQIVPFKSIRYFAIFVQLYFLRERSIVALAIFCLSSVFYALSSVVKLKNHKA